MSQTDLSRRLDALDFENKHYGESDEVETVRKLYISLYVALILTTLAYMMEILFAILFATGASGDINYFAFSVSPTFIIALVLFSIAFGLILNVLALCCLPKRGREGLIGAFFGHFLLLPIFFTAFILLLLRGNGVVALDSQNEGAQAFFNNEVSLNAFSLSTSKLIVEFSLNDDNAEIWKTLQDDNNCCGLNLVSLYAKETLDVENFDRTKLLTGVQCGLAETQITNLLTNFPEFNEDTADAIETAVEDDPTLGNRNFFCESDLSAGTKKLAQTGSIVFAITLFLQIYVMTVTGLLVYTYTENVGGMGIPEGNLDATANVENTVVAKAGFNNGGSSPGKTNNRHVARGSKPLRF